LTTGASYSREAAIDKIGSRALAPASVKRLRVGRRSRLSVASRTVQAWPFSSRSARAGCLQPPSRARKEPQKRKYVTPITDGRGAASYIHRNRHTYWKKGIGHDLDLGPHGCCALYRPRHARCAVVNLHSGLKGHREQLSPVRRGRIAAIAR
jgi:hypothetical protein